MKRKKKGLVNKGDIKKTPKPNIFKVLKPYKGLLVGLLLFALLSNALNLVIPKIIQNGIDNF
jgi:ATP-binding cassette subfamily B protein